MALCQFPSALGGNKMVEACEAKRWQPVVGVQFAPSCTRQRVMEQPHALSMNANPFLVPLSGRPACFVDPASAEVS